MTSHFFKIFECLYLISIYGINVSVSDRGSPSRYLCCLGSSSAVIYPQWFILLFNQIKAKVVNVVNAHFDFERVVETIGAERDGVTVLLVPEIVNFCRACDDIVFCCLLLQWEGPTFCA